MQHEHGKKSKWRHDEQGAPAGSTRAYRPGSIEACLAAAHTKSASKEQTVPETTHDEHNRPQAHKMHTARSEEAAKLKQHENELHYYSELYRVYKRNQADAASDTHSDSAANSTAKSIAKHAVNPNRTPTGKENKKKTAGEFTPYCVKIVR